MSHSVKQTIMKLLVRVCFLSLVTLVSTSPPIHSFEKRVLAKMVETRKCLCHLCRVPILLRSGKKRQGGSSFPVMGVRSLTTTFQCVPPGGELTVILRMISTPWISTLPSPVEHRCGNSGIELMVKELRKELEDAICVNLFQPFPAIYLRVRSKYTHKSSEY